MRRHAGVRICQPILSSKTECLPSSVKPPEWQRVDSCCLSNLLRCNSLQLTHPCQVSVGGSVSDGFRCDAIASPSFASLLFIFSVTMLTVCMESGSSRSRDKQACLLFLQELIHKQTIYVEFPSIINDFVSGCDSYFWMRMGVSLKLSVETTIK